MTDNFCIPLFFLSECKIMAKAKSTSTTKLPRTKAISKPSKIKIAKPVTIPVIPVTDNLLTNPTALPVVDPVIPIQNDIPEIVPNTNIEVNGDNNEINTPAVTHKPLTRRSGLSVVIGLAGGSTVAYFAYDGFKTMFQDKGYDQDKANQYALLSAGLCGLITFGILYKIIR